MPSRIDEAGHTKAFDYPVTEDWGESRNVQFLGWDSNRQHIGPEFNALPNEPPRFPRVFDVLEHNSLSHKKKKIILLICIHIWN